jgi:hypothetical protein
MILLFIMAFAMKPQSYSLAIMTSIFMNDNSFYETAFVGYMLVITTSACTINNI